MEEQSPDVVGIISFVCGVLALLVWVVTAMTTLLACVCGVVGAILISVLSVTGLILGLIAIGTGVLARLRQESEAPRAYAWTGQTGLILGSVSSVGSCFTGAFAGFLFALLGAIVAIQLAATGL
jgi:hypothetical protein